MKLLKKQSLGEEIANAVSHGVGALAGIAGIILLLIKSDSTAEIFSSIIFGLGMVMLYTMSTLYHSFRNGSTVKRVFQRLDHISIYALIGGTFAPIFILVIEKPLGWILLAVQWAFIILGIVLKAVMIHKFAWVHLILFLVIGWSGLTLIGPLYQVSSQAFNFILFGGISYTIGVIFYVFHLFKYSHFIWHLFVFLGTLLHFIAIYSYLF